MNIFDLIKKSKKVEPSSAPTGATAGKPAEEKKVGERNFVEGLVSTKDIIAPGALEVDTDFIKIGNKFYRTVFTVINRRFVEVNWLSTLINFDASLAVSIYIYPSDGKEILDDLRRKITEMEAELTTDIQRGRIVNPATQAKLEDALNLQADLVKGEERFFQMGLYVTISSDTKDDLDRVTKNLEAAMGALMVLTKKTSYDAENAFITTLPLASDRLNLTRNMDTTSLATTFPFVSSDLSDDKGIMYGINEHNGSLVIFDRFSMQNYNSVVFATAGAGKSYMIKLEALRSLIMGTEIIVIDPENEYKDLCEAVGGQYIAFGYGEDSKINPFDLSLVVEEGDNALNSKILSVHKLLKIMLGAMDPLEESILDRAVVDAYKMKGITPDPESQTKEPPLVEDLYKALIGMEDPKAQGIAARMEKYIKGSFAGIFNQKTTVNLKNEFVVFGIRNLEESLRPVAMHIILDYIWTVVKREMRRRILVVDEAWYLMQYEDSAAFLRGIVKRGRKYYLGVTTITQDVDDFLETPYGREIVTNSAIQILLKQHSAAIDQIGEVFYLSEGEKQLLLSADKGEGIFFAGQNHVAIRVVASEDEHKIITSNPEEIMKMKAEVKRMKEEAQKLKDLDRPPVPKFSAAALVEETATEQEKNFKLQTSSEQLKPPVVQNPSVSVATETSPFEKGSLALEKNFKLQTSSEEMKPNPSGPTVVAQSNPSPPSAASPFDQPTSKDSGLASNGGLKTEDVLSRRIAEMEAVEKTKIEEHQKQVATENELKLKEEEEKKKAQSSLGGFGSLPKYQDLFVNKGKLPPLPPLPKFEPPKAEVVQNTKPFDSAQGKPTFVSLPKDEVKIPQPPQLAKKTMPVFEQPKPPVVQNHSVSVVTEASPLEQPKPPVPPVGGTAPLENGGLAQEKKPSMDYDKLFGNGIV